MHIASKTPVRLAALLVSVLLRPSAHAAPGPVVACITDSGRAGRACLRDYVDTVAGCRLREDADCEADARAAGGALESLLASSDAASEASCTEDSARTLGYIGLADVGFRIAEACGDFGEDFLDLVFADPMPGGLLDCQRKVVRELDRLRRRVEVAFGERCYLRAYDGASCLRARRDGSVARFAARATARIARRCGNDFDTLGLVAPDAAPTLAERVGVLAALIVQRGRHYAQRVYPPNSLGPAAEFGPFPVGVRTLPLSDPSRLNVQGTGPRPVRLEVYYPSTAEAVEGVPRDVAIIFGTTPVAETPAYRNVARAAGTFPVVLFSHGNRGIRFQNVYFCAHLASHGFVVASPDHHGNTFQDVTPDPEPQVNRPLDMSFIIDQLEAMNVEPGHFLEGGIDPTRIGASGHSFGGYTTFSLGGGANNFGTFTDARVKALMPQAPASSDAFFPDAFFATVTIPTLVLGGSIDETTPFPEHQQHAFDLLPSGAAVVGLAQQVDAGHFSFSDYCEVPRNLLVLLNGYDQACAPRHLPWRHARDISSYLGLSFFDGVLNGNAEALARLAPENLAAIEDLAYQSK